MRSVRRSSGRGAAGPDRATLRRGAAIFLAGIGEPELAADRRRTPARVADAWSREILGGYREDPARILATGIPGHETGMVVVRDIPFVSVCVHHLLPFRGTAQVAYLPDRRLVGLSKISRAVDALARRLQLQERLTRQIVQAIERALRPRGVACRMEAEHLCMTIRGARQRGSRVVTFAAAGAFLRSAALRSEFLRLGGDGTPIAAGRRPGGGRRRVVRRPGRREAS
jgi:GTP cyclohydrolase I